MAWFASLSPDEFAVPSIAVYEMQAGLERAHQLHIPRAEELNAWLDRLDRVATIIPVDAASARETARLIHGKSLDLLEDAMITAIARVNGLTIATRNTKDFQVFGVAQVNPFQFAKK